MHEIYLDYAATTPVDPRVLRAMQPYFTENFGNPGSLHRFGQQAQAAVDEAREILAGLLSCPPAGGFREIIFTGSATEANNLALRGVLKGYSQWGLANRMNSKNLNPNGQTLYPPKIIVSAAEHESVLETARDLARRGEAEVVELPVDRNGTVDLRSLAKNLDERTVLVSIMYANNETGAVQPLAAIAKIIKGYSQWGIANRVNSKTLNPNSYWPYPLFHTDAVQAFQFLPCRPAELGVDLMTLSAHKIYGPKGVGALYVRQSESERRKATPPVSFAARCSLFAPPVVSPLTTGGGQEFGLRSGTENVAGLVGFAAAAKLAADRREKEGERLRELRGELWRGIRRGLPKSKLNLVFNNRGRISPPLPHVLNVWLPGLKAEETLTRLDLLGLMVSGGSACSAHARQPSHVLRAMGFTERRANESIRFSLGRLTGPAEVAQAVRILKTLRSFGKKTPESYENKL